MQLSEENRRQMFGRPYFESIEAPTSENELRKPTLFDLIFAYQAALENRPKITVHEIQKIPITIEEQTEFILKKFDDKIQLSFLELISEIEERIVLVVTFLAILEMAKSQVITILTRDDHHDFWISRV
jgi:segregation and condensation protein A